MLLSKLVTIAFFAYTLISVFFARKALPNFTVNS